MDDDESNGPLWERKRKLITDITKLVGDRTRPAERPLNIAVIGTMGTGKSSFINSVMAAFSLDRWRMYARSGPGAVPGTAYNKLYDQLENMEEYRRFNMPRFFDMAGFPDENTDKWFEVMQIVIGGRLPQAETITTAEEHYDSMFKKYGTEAAKTKFRKRYSRQDPDRCIDRVLFVGCFTRTPSYNLIRCVKRVAGSLGGIPVFGIMTMEDCRNPDGTADQTVNNFREELGIDGNMFLSCSNYCDQMDRILGFRRTERLHPRLCVPILEFLLQVCDPVIRAECENLRHGSPATDNRPSVGFGFWSSFTLTEVAGTLAGILVMVGCHFYNSRQ